MDRKKLHLNLSDLVIQRLDALKTIYPFGSRTKIAHFVLEQALMSGFPSGPSQALIQARDAA